MSYLCNMDFMLSINNVLCIAVPKVCERSKICSHINRCNNCIFYNDIITWSLNNIRTDLNDKYVAILSSLPKVDKNIKDNYGLYLSKIFTNDLFNEIKFFN